LKFYGRYVNFHFISIEENGQYTTPIPGSNILKGLDPDEAIEYAIQKTGDSFSIRAIQNRYPGVSNDMIGKVFKEMQKDGRVECQGKGQSAKWKRI
jgi:hypothetical protein